MLLPGFANYQPKEDQEDTFPTTFLRVSRLCGCHKVFLSDRDDDLFRGYTVGMASGNEYIRKVWGIVK